MKVTAIEQDLLAAKKDLDKWQAYEGKSHKLKFAAIKSAREEIEYLERKKERYMLTRKSI